MLRSFCCRLFMAVMALCALPLSASAQEKWPDGPVVIVNPFPAGGGVDAMVRAMAAELSKASGEQFIVENRAGGAGGSVGSSYVARARPDGKVFGVMNFAAHAVQPHILKDLPYGPQHSGYGITPISMMGGQAAALLVRPDFPAKSFAELLTLMKQAPERYTIAHTGIGGTSWLCARSLQRLSGASLREVGYKGDAPALTDLLGGHVQLFFATVTAARSHVDSGQLRALAVSSAHESEALPGVAPAGKLLTGFAHTTWNGINGPPGLPQHIVDAFAKLVAQAHQSPELKAAYARLGITPIVMEPAQTAAFLRAESENVRPILEAAGALAPN